MDEEQRRAREAQIAEMMLALQVAIEWLDRLEARTAREEKAGAARPYTGCNPVAQRIAVAMTKSGSGTDKA
jgi:hypothetical protein